MSSSSGSDAGGDDGEYVVERIVKKRIVRGGKVEYFLKWKNYSEAENTWEPEEHLGCPELIAEFEKEWEEREMRKKAAATEKTNGKKRSGLVSASKDDSKKGKENKGEGGAAGLGTSKKIKSETPKATGFDRGFQPERIIGATTDDNGKTMFLIKWKDTQDVDLVSARQANVKCPQIVIGFYEERFTWHTNAGDDSESDDD